MPSGLAQATQAALLFRRERSVRENHGNGIDPAHPGLQGLRRNARRSEHRPLGRDPPFDFHHAGNLNRAARPVQGEEVRTALVAESHEIAEAQGGQEQHRTSSPFQQGVGCHRRSPAHICCILAQGDKVC